MDLQKSNLHLSDRSAILLRSIESMRSTSSGGGSAVKFRVERDVLAEAVAWTAKSLPARPQAPVLAGLMLSAAGEELVISGFDYEVSSRSQLSAQVEQDGTVLVSGKLLADIARALPNRPVEFSTDGPKHMPTRR